jgi:iron complex outermembrane receptor protein
MMKIKFQRFTPVTTGKQMKKFDNQISPGICVMKRYSLGAADFNIYAGLSKGFSPPATTDLFPTGSAINLGLEPEEGTNYSLGVKTTLNSRLYVDLNVFLFSLKNTIVQRRDAGGGDFYINAGKTKQEGVETYAGYSFFSGRGNEGFFWLSHTWHDFHYDEFKQVNNDFSGKRMPATAPHTVSSGVDLKLKNGITGALTYYFSDKIPLNDANTDFADAYHLLGAKLGCQKTLKDKWKLRLMVGADNLLDQKYSLGNDINAFGGRYYNAAPGRNFYVSLMVQWMSKKIFQ